MNFINSIGHNNRRRKKNVTFNPLVEVISSRSAPLSKLDANVWNELWYKPDELKATRTEAIELCRNLIKNKRRRRMEEDLSQAEVYYLDDDYNDPTSSIRGLEQQMCSIRQKRKYTIIKFIVKLHNMMKKKNVKDHDDQEKELANVSCHITAKAKGYAREIGARDSQCAYYYYYYHHHYHHYSYYHHYHFGNKEQLMMMENNKRNFWDLNHHHHHVVVQECTSHRRVRPRLLLSPYI